MTQLPRKELYEITLKNLAPPYLDYEYFKNSAQLPFRHASNVFDMVNAWWLIEAATLVYAEKEFVTENFKKNAGLSEVKFFSGKSTQCFVAGNDQFAIVAFRGSEARLRESDADPRHVIADWMADFDFLPVPWDRGGKVHRGFKEALQEVWPGLEEYISNLLKNNRKIWITGHSLGAALATLAADRCENIQGLYTYGSPRVGDGEFKKNFKVNGYRFVNNSDIATKVPPAGIYRHVGEIRFIDSDGVIHDNTDRQPSWADEIQGQIKDVIEALRQTGKGLTGALFEPIVNHVPTLYAIHIWNNLVSGIH
jgi:triacylglycerol lipase